MTEKEAYFRLNVLEALVKNKPKKNEVVLVGGIGLRVLS